jgi:hypothetical protein
VLSVIFNRPFRLWRTDPTCIWTDTWDGLRERAQKFCVQRSRKILGGKSQGHFHPFSILSVCLIFCLTVYLSLYACVYLYLSIAMIVCLILYLTFYLFFFKAVCNCLSLKLYNCVFVFLSQCL